MSSRLSSCPVRIPKAFKADLIINKSPLSKDLRADSKKNLKDTMHFILNSIIQQMETREGRDYMEDGGLVYLHSDILNDICGNRYTKALKILEEEGVIYRDSSYSVGNHSKGVSFMEQYAISDYRYVEISNGKIKDKILKHRQELERRNALELAKTPYITKWFNSNLTVNVDGVHNFVEFYKSRMQKLHKESGDSLDIQSRINQRYNSSLRSVDRILEADFGLQRTGKDNRLHSTVSSMKKELRSFLKYNGESLVGIDIKSSQPYLLTQLLKEEFYEKKKDLNIYSIYHELGELIPLEEIRSILMSVSYDHSFSQVKWDEDFYSHLIKLDELKHRGVKQIFKTRTDVKKKMMVTLYDKKHKLQSFKRFQEFFPREAKLISAFHGIGDKQDNYLPILMQRLESRLMLDIVCKEVSIQLPDAPIIPIHDSIMTTEKYQDRVRDIMHDTLSKYTGVSPGLKIENDSQEDRLNHLEDTVIEDLQDIYQNKSKRNIPVSSKSPLLYDFPKLNGKQIISTAYIDPDISDSDYQIDYSEDGDKAD